MFWLLCKVRTVPRSCTRRYNGASARVAKSSHSHPRVTLLCAYSLWQLRWRFDRRNNSRRGITDRGNWKRVDSMGGLRGSIATIAVVVWVGKDAASSSMKNLHMFVTGFLLSSAAHYMMVRSFLLPRDTREIKVVRSSEGIVPHVRLYVLKVHVEEASSSRCTFPPSWYYS
jgi:hypothetical protein